MLIRKNPSNEKINELIEISEQKTANWIKDLEDGAVYYWPANSTTHSRMSEILHIDQYEKGIIVSAETD